MVTTGGWWLCVWDLSVSGPVVDNRLVGAISFFPQSLNVAQWDPHGFQLAFGGDMGYIGLVRKFEGLGMAVFENKMMSLRENWQEVARLLGHKSDVVDLAWRSPSMLASASLDNSIIVWNVQTHERMLKLEGHTSFVKAVSWDPRGKFLASISDDQSVIIWGIPSGEIQTVVTKPFEKSPVSSRTGMKIDWSPDGRKLVAVNATKNDSVQLSAVISRTNWTYEYRGIEGHGSTAIAIFNPFKFIHGSREFYYWVSAGTAGVINIWKEPVDGVASDFDKEPVATRVLGRIVSDLCWCPDGYGLLIATREGVVMKWKITPETLGKMESDVRCLSGLANLIGNPLEQQTVRAPAVRRGPGKRIVPQRIEELDEFEGTPGKRRRLGSLTQGLATQTTAIKNHFQISMRCRRANKCEVHVFNHQHGDETCMLLYQELGNKIWSLKLNLLVAHGAANDTFLCVCSSDNQLMVAVLTHRELVTTPVSL